ncbi:hypothetical protein ES703_27631 [subsurface metagenome]
MSVAVRIPPTVGTAIGFITSEPVPVENITAMSARIVVAVVITMGLTLRRAASTIISLRGLLLPSLFTFCKRYSTMTTPASIATPKRAIYPTHTAVENLYPNRNWSQIPPIKANGRAIMSIDADDRDLNFT